MLNENAPRSGFFEKEQFEAIRRHLPQDLQVAVTISRTYSWRIRSEVMNLGVAQVDLEAGTLRLDPGQTKNDDGRVVCLTPELKVMLGGQIDRVMGLMRARSEVIPHLFSHLLDAFRGSLAKASSRLGSQRVMLQCLRGRMLTRVRDWSRR
jgi:integrase